MTTPLSIQLKHTHSHFSGLNPVIPYCYLLKAKVDASEFRISQIAKKIGYQNINKGSRRIHTWIQQDTVPNDPYGQAFLNFVGVTQAELSAHRKAYSIATHRAATYREQDFELNLLKKHVNFLLDHRSTICSTKQYDDVLLPNIGIFIYMAVVPPFVLGQLLESWRDGVLKRGDLYFYKGIGSPLSGTHKVYGFSAKDGRTQSVPQGLGSYSGTRQQCRKYTQSQSKWSLGQVLVDLGLTLPPTTIYQHGVAIGQYDYASHQLILHNQTWDLSYEFSSPNERTIIGKDMILQQFILHRQNIKYEGNVLAHWTQDLPPIVAQHICIQLPKMTA